MRILAVFAGELVRSTTSPVDAILVGLERRTGLTLTEPVAFTLTVETF